MPCSCLWWRLAAFLLVSRVLVTGQELLGASQGFPALGELVGVIADEVSVTAPSLLSGTVKGLGFWCVQQKACS